MDHVRALQERLAERYLLGEMSAVETEEFERHYFECQECAAAVEDGQILVANAQAVLSEPASGTEPDQARAPDPRGSPGESFWDSWFGWWQRPAFGLAAAAILAAISLYQAVVVIPGLHRQTSEPRALPSFQLLPASRGDAQQINIPSGAPSFAVAADVPPDAHFPAYSCELLGPQGATLFRVAVPAPAVGQPITILVPTGQLEAARYSLNVYGVDAGGQQHDKIASFGFVLQYH